MIGVAVTVPLHPVSDNSSTLPGNDKFSRPLFIGLPFGLLVVLMGIAIVDVGFYSRWVAAHENGFLEHGTVLMLAVGVAVGIRTFCLSVVRCHRRLLAWTVVVTLGALYFGGEEISWGQNFLHWQTPDVWQSINKQQETNLHNINPLLGDVQRHVIILAAVACLFAPWLRKKILNSDRMASVYLPLVLPGRAMIAVGLVGVLVRLTRVFVILAFEVPVGPNSDDITRSGTTSFPAWFDRMFLTGGFELEEFYLAMLILLYLVSLRRQVLTESNWSSSPM